MASSRLHRATAACALLIAAASCRSILDIEPGRPLEDSAGSAGKGSGGKGNPSGGSNAEGGAVDPAGGADSPTAGKGTSGSSQGGTPATAGNANVAGEDAGGAGGNAPTSPFPEGSCTDCLARNCAEQTEACLDEATCLDGIPTWLECAEPVAQDCVSADAGALQDLETCGARSCDVCRHTTDGEPSIEILTPSNGAVVVPNEMGRIEVSARVHNFTLKGINGCGTDLDCGHVHFNLDEANCSFGFFNTWTFTGDDEGNVDLYVDTTACKTPIVGPVEIRASLSSSMMHADRVPHIESIVTVTVNE